MIRTSTSHSPLTTRVALGGNLAEIGGFRCSCRHGQGADTALSWEKGGSTKMAGKVGQGGGVPNTGWCLCGSERMMWEGRAVSSSSNSSSTGSARASSSNSQGTSGSNSSSYGNSNSNSYGNSKSNSYGNSNSSSNINRNNNSNRSSNSGSNSNSNNSNTTASGARVTALAPDETTRSIAPSVGAVFPPWPGGICLVTAPCPTLSLSASAVPLSGYSIRFLDVSRAPTQVSGTCAHSACGPIPTVTMHIHLYGIHIR
jgi:hypothetical protein